ncbi:hypothetical protein MIDIC_460030 [Alphaproteobacteria bacterium]
MPELRRHGEFYLVSMVNNGVECTKDGFNRLKLFTSILYFCLKYCIYS